MDQEKLKETSQALVAPGKGILAADESIPTIGKRFDKINLENTEVNRKAYREMLLTTPDIGEYISGVIMFDETIRQKTSDGRSFVSVLETQRVLPGIKVDQSTAPQESSPDEKITRGLEGLPERLREYVSLGAKFTKWRAVITIDEEKSLPTDGNIIQNAKDLAQYALSSQQAGLVPMVEPEILMDGKHSMERCAQVTRKTLEHLFQELSKVGSFIEGLILKTNMVVPGKESGEETSPENVADATVKLLKETLPGELPGVAFLSGGQSEIEATENLNVMNKNKDLPWRLGFSYGRALQDSALRAWNGKPENVSLAQEKFIHRARMNSLATLGEYSLEAEQNK